FPAFDHARVCPVHSHHMGELLLAEPLSAACLGDLGSKSDQHGIFLWFSWRVFLGHGKSMPHVNRLYVYIRSVAYHLLLARGASRFITTHGFPGTIDLEVVPCAQPPL